MKNFQLLLPFIFVFGSSGTSIQQNFNDSILLTRYDKYNDVIYAGSVDALYKLSAKNISNVLGTIKWNSNVEMETTCRNFQDDYLCRNHVILINQINSSQIRACGTASFSPYCCFIDTDSFEMVSCAKAIWSLPFRPSASVFADISGDKVATLMYAGFYGDMPYVSVTSATNNVYSNRIKTDDDYDYFNEAGLGGMYIRKTRSRRHEKGYFFFHERARESSSFALGISPYKDDYVFRIRAASICLNDIGGTGRDWKRRLTSFEAVSMICASREGGYIPHYQHYNHIKQTHLIENEEDEQNPMVVGLFASEDGKSSAICVYNFQDIQWKLDSREYWKHPSDPQSDKLYMRDNSHEDECPNHMLSQSRIDFKVNHKIKAGFVRSLFDHAVYHDNQKLFTSFTFHQTSEFVHLLLASDDGLVRRVLLHSSNLAHEPRAPLYTVLPDYIPSQDAKPVLKGLLQLESSFVVGVGSTLYQRSEPGCDNYQNCSICNSDYWCIWSEKKEVCEMATENFEVKPTCTTKPVEEVNTTESSHNRTDELKEATSKSKHFERDLGLCRQQLKHMKGWSEGEIVKMKSIIDEKTLELETCSNESLDQSEEFRKTKIDLDDRYESAQVKLDSLREEILSIKLGFKDKLNSKCSTNNNYEKNLTSVCDCRTNIVSRGFGWFYDRRSQNKYFISEKMVSFDGGKRFCERLGTQMASLIDNKKGFIKKMVNSIKPNWRIWVDFRTKVTKKQDETDKEDVDKYTEPAFKCLQLAKNGKWDLTHCLKPAHPICRKIGRRFAVKNAIKVIKRSIRRQKLEPDID